MNDLKVTDLSGESRAIPNPVTTFQQAFSNYRQSGLYEICTCVCLSVCLVLFDLNIMLHLIFCSAHIIIAEILDEITKAGFQKPTPIQVPSSH